MRRSVIPRKKSEAISWILARVGTWQQNFQILQLDEAEITAMKAAAQDASTDLNAAETAAAAARSATLQSDTSAALARRLAQDNLDRIRVAARTSADPAQVWIAADVPEPATPSALPPPGVPSGFRVELNTDGSLKLTWKCVNPVGASNTVYFVRRSVSGGAFTLAGVSGEKSFVDSGVPIGSTTVSYTVQGQRGQSLGAMSLEFTIRFGTTGGGGLTIMSASEGVAKLAA